VDLERQSNHEISRRLCRGRPGSRRQNPYPAAKRRGNDQAADERRRYRFSVDTENVTDGNTFGGEITVPERSGEIIISIAGLKQETGWGWPSRFHHSGSPYIAWKYGRRMAMKNRKRLFRQKLIQAPTFVSIITILGSVVPVIFQFAGIMRLRVEEVSCLIPALLIMIGGILFGERFSTLRKIRERLESLEKTMRQEKR
jgi:hypothetical protein